MGVERRGWQFCVCLVRSSQDEPGCQLKQWWVSLEKGRWRGEKEQMDDISFKSDFFGSPLPQPQINNGSLSFRKAGMSLNTFLNH